MLVFLLSTCHLVACYGIISLSHYRRTQSLMAQLLEYVGYVHIFLGPYRGNPISLYLRMEGDQCSISPKVYPWNEVIGEGETPSKAAASFIEKWKARGLPEDVYSGPTWEGIKPEKPPPPKPAAGTTPKPASSDPLPPTASGVGATTSAPSGGPVTEQVKSPAVPASNPESKSLPNKSSSSPSTVSVTGPDSPPQASGESKISETSAPSSSPSQETPPPNEQKS